MSQKGEPIRFVAGTYNGKRGWIDISRAATAKMFPVIVDMGEGVEKITAVRKTSVQKQSERKEPSSFEEAILDQQPKVKHAMKRLVTKLA